MSVNETATTYLSESRGYNAEIMNVETRLEMARYLKNYVSNLGDRYEMIPVNTGLNDANADATIAQYNNLILRRQALVEASSTQSPAVKQLDASLQTLRNNIVGIIDNIVVSLNIKKNDLSKHEREAIQKFSTMPTKALDVLSIERQQKIKEALYIYLLNKREENTLAEAMVDNNAKLLDAAEGSPVPVSPSKNKMMLLAILMGLLVPAVILLFRLFIDTKVHTRKELEDALSIPFLAEIPLKKVKRTRKKTGLEKTLAYDKNSKGIFTEAMRMMCTNLEFMKPEGVDHIVLASTSIAVDAGKTFTTLNMAACLADANKKVVLVDLDLRKRTLSGLLDLKCNWKISSISMSSKESTSSRPAILRRTRRNCSTAPGSTNSSLS